MVVICVENVEDEVKKWLLLCWLTSCWQWLWSVCEVNARACCAVACRFAQRVLSVLPTQNDAHVVSH